MFGPVVDVADGKASRKILGNQLSVTDLQHSRSPPSLPTPSSDSTTESNHEDKKSKETHATDESNHEDKKSKGHRDDDNQSPAIYTKRRDQKGAEDDFGDEEALRKILDKSIQDLEKYLLSPY